jgi:hypothetical protein
VARLLDDDGDLDVDALEEAEEEREDLATALRQAKRKPRHFAIVAKGVEVLALYARKKPFRAGTLRQVRRETGGKQIIQGICQGDGGANLVFKVVGDPPKVKKSQLREFISKTTGMMIKPRFEGVAKLEE